MSPSAEAGLHAVQIGRHPQHFRAIEHIGPIPRRVSPRRYRLILCFGSSGSRVVAVSSVVEVLRAEDATTHGGFVDC